MGRGRGWEGKARGILVNAAGGHRWGKARGILLIGGALLLNRLTNSAARWDHIRFLSHFPPSQRPPLGGIRGISSGGSYPLEIDLSNEESKRRLLNRLLYRSKQRGFLELDLVLGKWVEEHIHSLDQNGIKSLVDILNLENPDLWKWLTGQEHPPEAVSKNLVFCGVREEVMNNLNSHSAPETRAMPGKPWVRGWDDIKKARDGPVSGNQLLFHSSLLCSALGYA